MFELIYKKIYTEHTSKSQFEDEVLDQKIEELLDGKDISVLDEDEIEDIIYAAGVVGHKQGFLCAIEFIREFFSEIFRKEGRYD